MINEFASTSGVMLRILPPVMLYPTSYPSTLIEGPEGPGPPITPPNSNVVSAVLASVP